jgi:hypothetical protein
LFVSIAYAAIRAVVVADADTHRDLKEANRQREIDVKPTDTTAETPTNTPLSEQTGVELSLRNPELRYRRLFEKA